MARTDVELVEEDAAAVDGEQPAGAARRPGFVDRVRRHPVRSLIAGAAAVALVVSAVVVQSALDARERARTARLMALPGVVHPVELPLRSLFSLRGDQATVLGARVGGLYVGGVARSGADTPPTVSAVDAGTGAEVWQVTLDPPPAPAELPSGDDFTAVDSLSVVCYPFGSDELVACVLTRSLGFRRDPEGVFSSDVGVSSSVVLDAADGSVLWRQDMPPGSQVVVVGDALWVLSRPGDGSAVQVVALSADGSRRWEQRVEVPEGTPALETPSVQVDGAQALLAVGVHGWFLDPQDGAVLREVGPRGQEGWLNLRHGLVVAQTFEVVDGSGGTVTGSSLWRDDGTEVRLGPHDATVIPAVDDASRPGVTLVQAEDGTARLRAVDRTGRTVWKSKIPVVSAAVVLDGVAYVTTGVALMAVDLDDGTVRWKHVVAGGAQYLLFDGRSLITFSANVAQAYDPSDGSPRWTAWVFDDGDGGHVTLREVEPDGTPVDPDPSLPSSPSAATEGPSWWYVDSDGRLVRASSDSSETQTFSVFG